MEQESQNLSEILFKPKFNYPETSVISNSGCPLPELSREDLMFENTPGSRPELFDTVSEYGSGHWTYEFCSIAQRRFNLANKCVENSDPAGASHHYRLAARYFSIAAYPYLKSDVLADNAEVLCRTAYRKMFEIDSTIGILQEHSFEVDGKKVSGYLHLPDLSQVYPCIVLLCNYESSISTHYRDVTKLLKEHQIAVFVIEMPGAGGCERLNLNDHMSAVVESSLDYLASLKYVDSANLGIMGIGISGTSCIRASVMKPDAIKAMALTVPFVHSFFTSREILNSLPLCLRSSLCNRLDLDASSWDLVIPRLKVFSLKEQGILSSSRRSRIPTLVNIYENSVVTKEDLQILENNFQDLTVNTGKASMGLAQFTLDSMQKITEFFVRHFSS